MTGGERVVIGEHRKRTLRRRPLPRPLAANVALPAIGYAVTALGLVTAALLVL